MPPNIYKCCVSCACLPCAAPEEVINIKRPAACVCRIEDSGPGKRHYLRKPCDMKLKWAVLIRALQTMRCHHVKRRTDRMTVDHWYTIVHLIPFSAWPSQFSERYRQTRCVLGTSRCSGGHLYGTQIASLPNEVRYVRDGAKGVPSVLPPSSEISMTYMRVLDPTTSLFTICCMRHKTDECLSRSL